MLHVCGKQREGVRWRQGADHQKKCHLWARLWFRKDFGWAEGVLRRSCIKPKTIVYSQQTLRYFVWHQPFLLIFHLGWSPKKAPTSPKISHKIQGKHCFLGTCGGPFWWTNTSGNLPTFPERQEPTQGRCKEKTGQTRDNTVIWSQEIKTENQRLQCCTTK